MEPQTIKMSIEELAYVISPPGHIKSDVAVLKDDIHFLIGNRFADLYTKAHVALFRFNEGAYFDDINQHVAGVAGTLTPFNIFLKDLSVLSTGATHRIAINILNKYPLREVFEKILCKNTRYMPHISVASRLSDEDLNKAWPYLKDFAYSQHFVCDRISVFARRGLHWSLYREIPFSDTPGRCV